MALLLLDYLGTMAFAVSGALKGVRGKMDIFGVVVLGAVTAIGGGTIRDVLLDIPVFWLTDQTYVLLAIVSAVGVFLLYRLVRKTERALLVFDAIGLGIFTAIGALKAQQADLGAVGIVTMACLTGVGGGMIRDVLARDVPVVLREEIYASASIAGALVFGLLVRIGTTPNIAIWPAAGLTVLVRIASIFFNWQLPRREAAEQDEAKIHQ